MNKSHKSIVIIGGGPVGATTAISLAKTGKEVTLIDQFSESRNSDGRVLALSYASLVQLEGLGLNLTTIGTPIDKVHISHNGLGVNNINAQDINLKHLGYTVKYTDVVNLLYQKIKKYPTITLQKSSVTNVIPGNNFATVMYDSDGILTADLAILAEGGNVRLNGVSYRKHDYKQHAVIARIKSEVAHNNIAYERFEQDGSMVLLPHDNEFILVWALENALLNDNQLHNDSEKLYKILQKLPFMKRFGKFELVGNIHSFPLKLQIAGKSILDSVILIGNSSHIVHPVSAQGLNLGLRDVRDLCNILNTQENMADVTRQYADLRKNDIKFVSGFTHFLAKFLEIQNPIINHARGLGIMALSNCRFLQNKLTHSLVFGIAN